MKKILVLTVVGISLAFSSATLFSGTTQNVSFNSDPKGAKVLIDEVEKCKTPCTLTLKRGSYDNVTFKKDGYQSKTLPLEKTYNNTAFFSLF